MNKKFWACILLLVLADIASSTSAVFFCVIQGITGSLKASWRLQATSLAQIPLTLPALRSDPIKAKRFYSKYWWLLLLASIAAAGYFSLWASSLEKTSIAHGLAFSSSSPFLAIVIQFFLENKPNILQVTGATLSFVGLLTMVLTDSSDEDSSIYGDVLAFMACVLLLAYLYLGKFARKLGFMFVYLCPVNFMAAVFSYIFAISMQQENPGKVVEWLYTSNGLYVLYLGIVPGIVGHATYNYVLNVISPILVTAFINFQPLIGSFIGWIAGYQGNPTLWTWIGGILLIIGNTTITIGEKIYIDRQRRREEENREISIKLASESS